MYKKLSSGAIIALISSLFLCVVVVIAYNRVAKPVIIDNIPLVSNDKCLTQMPPENPGGMVISNQNKMIYDPIKSAKSQDKESIASLPNTDVKREEDKLSLLQARRDKIFGREELPEESTEPDESVVSSIFDLAWLDPDSGAISEYCTVKIGQFKNKIDAENMLFAIKRYFNKKDGLKDTNISTDGVDNKKRFLIYIEHLDCKSTTDEICKYVKNRKLECGVIKE